MGNVSHPVNRTSGYGAARVPVLHAKEYDCQPMCRHRATCLFALFAGQRDRPGRCRLETFQLDSAGALPRQRAVEVDPPPRAHYPAPSGQRLLPVAASTYFMSRRSAAILRKYFLICYHCSSGNMPRGGKMARPTPSPRKNSTNASGKSRRCATDSAGTSHRNLIATSLRLRIPITAAVAAAAEAAVQPPASRLRLLPQ